MNIQFTEEEFILRMKSNHKKHCARIEDPTSSKSERSLFSVLRSKPQK